MILTNLEEIFKKVNSAVFPYYQGGPLENIIAGKAICFEEAQTNNFRDYIKAVKANTKWAAKRFKELGAEVSGTETHLFLLNTLKSYNLTGLEAQKKLEEIGITTNKNMLPNDTLKPSETSGLRIGFAAATTRGCRLGQAISIASLIHAYLSGSIDKETAFYCKEGIIDEWKDISNLSA